MPDALVSPSVLQWARERRELSPEQLAASLPVKPEQVTKWESGEARPSIPQAENLARVLLVPLGYLFLDKPPKLGTPIPDLRTIGSREAADLSIDLRQLINDALLKQDWYREFLIEEGAEKVAFVGSFTVDSSALDVAAAIRSELELTLLDRRGSQDEYRRLLTERAEQSGVSVLRSGIVGANTHRRLDVEECRGFALPDPYAPLVFVNGRDFIAAQIFTLMHELAHIWIGVSGISNLDPASVPRAEYPAIEKFCNAVAAEILMPSDEVKAVWRTTMRTEVAVNFLARYFQVSKLAAVFRAKDLKLVSFSEANRLAESLEAYDGTPKGESGGNIYSTLPVRNGRSLTSAIIVAATDGRLPMTEAMRMLGVSDSVIQRAAREYGIR